MPYQLAFDWQGLWMNSLTLITMGIGVWPGFEILPPGPLVWVPQAARKGGSRFCCLFNFPEMLVTFWTYNSLNSHYIYWKSFNHPSDIIKFEFELCILKLWVQCYVVVVVVSQLIIPTALWEIELSTECYNSISSNGCSIPHWHSH